MNTTDPPHVQYVRKPVHTVMGLLAKLGEKQLQVNITGRLIMEIFYLTTHSTHFSSFFIIIFTSFVIGRLINTLKKKFLT